MKYLTKPPPAADRNGVAPPVNSGNWGERLPALTEFLSEAHWGDGSPRLVGSVTLFLDDGLWKLCLSDKDQGRVAFVSGLTPMDAFQAAERGLVEGKLDWRAQRAPGGKKPKN